MCEQWESQAFFSPTVYPQQSSSNSFVTIVFLYQTEIFTNTSMAIIYAFHFSRPLLLLTQCVN